MNIARLKVFKANYTKYGIPLLLVLLNFIVKGIFISNNSIGGDEPFSIYHAQMNVFSIINQLSTGNNPPFYEILLHFWVKIFGVSVLPVRFPSLVFSSLTTLFIYKIGFNHLNKRIAIFATLLFIFSNYQIGFAHEARVYALFVMLTSMSMFYYMNIISSKYQRKDIIILLITNVLLIYSHYFGFWILLIQLLIILINKELRINYWKQLLLFLFLIIILYLPNIGIIINRFIDSSTNGTWIKLPNGLYSLIDILRTFNNEQYGSHTIFGSKPILTIILLLTIIASTIKLIYHKFNITKNIKIQYIIFSFFIPFVIIFLISFKIPMFLDRYLIFTTIGYYFTIGIAIDNLFNNYLIKNIFGVVIIAGIILTTNPNISNKRNVKETVEKIKELKTDKTIVYFCPSWFEINFVYYFDIDCFKDYDYNDINMYKCLSNEQIYPIDNQKQIDFSELRKYDIIIFLDAGADFSFPENGILQKLKEKFLLKKKYHYYEIFNIYKFEKNKDE